MAVLNAVLFLLAVLLFVLLQLVGPSPWLVIPYVVDLFLLFLLSIAARIKGRR